MEQTERACCTSSAHAPAEHPAFAQGEPLPGPAAVAAVLLARLPFLCLPQTALEAILLYAGCPEGTAAQVAGRSSCRARSVVSILCWLKVYFLCLHEGL